MNVELRQLKHAVSVALHGSFAQAAQALHLSQSALSRSVQSLEREIGAPIFVRSQVGIVPTDVGRSVLRHGRAMLQVAAELDSRIVRNRSLQTGRVSVGIAATAAMSAAVDVTAELMAEQPGVMLNIRPGYRTDLLPSLRSGDLDLLVADSTAFPADDGEFDVQPLEEHPMVVVARAGHPLTGRSDLRLPDLIDFPIVAAGRMRPELLARVLEEQSRAGTPEVRQRLLPTVSCNSTSLIDRLVRRSDALCAMAPAAVAEAVETGELAALVAPPWLSAPCGIVTLRSRTLKPLARRFADRLVQTNALRTTADRQLIQRWFDMPTSRP